MSIRSGVANRVSWGSVAAETPVEEGPELLTLTRFAALSLALVVASAPAHAASPAATYRFVEDGLSIANGSTGTFTLRYPVAATASGGSRAIVEKRTDGARATLRYQGGGSIALAIAPDGTLDLSVASMPADVHTLRLGMVLPFGFSEGGSWRAGDGAAKAFPADKLDTPYLFQGSTARYEFTSGDGGMLRFEFPRAGYGQIQDNRAWDWKVFEWTLAMPVDGSTRNLRVRITATPGAARVRVDAFGQSAVADYGTKVRSADDLKADADSERRWLATFAPPARDAFGGVPGSGSSRSLKATGFFHLERTGGRDVLVDPSGNVFFQLGVCSMQPSDDFTYVSGRRSAYAWLPPPGDAKFASAYRPGDSTAFSFHLANVIKKTGRPYSLDDFLATNIARCRTWGFNSAGAFSPAFEPAERRARWPYVAMLPLMPWDGFRDLPGVPGTWDPFDDANRQRIARVFKERVAPHASDSLLIGWFFANEPIYDHLAGVLPSLGAAYACKRRLVGMLQDRYGTIAAFDKAWNANAKSFDELLDRGLDVSTAAARADVHAFVGQFLDAYYGLVSQTCRSVDPHHLLLGSRFQPRTIDQDEQLVRTCGRYVDVFSINYYTYAPDPAFLARMHDWSGGRPQLMSEFFFPSPSDSRLPGGGQEVDSQEQRGLAYRHYVEHAAALPYVVGVEWFTLVDMSVTGRWHEKYDGQDFNTGLISVADRPWRAMIEPMSKTNAAIYDVVFGRTPPFVFDDPRFRTTAAR